MLQREASERLRSRLFWVLTGVTMLGVVALIVVPALVSGSAKPTVIGLVGRPAQALGPSIEHTAAAAKVAVRVVPVADGPAARSALRRGSIAVALSVAPDGARAEVRQSLSTTIASLLRATVDAASVRERLRQAGVPLEKVIPALTPVLFTTRALEPEPPNRAARSAAALAAGLLLYVSLAIYAAAVAGGVAQEKTSRTAEVLLATVEPRQLLTGKVVGIGVCGLGQIAIAACAGLIANAAVHGTQIPRTVWLLLPAIVLWFVLGFAFYAFASAAGGALVARQEEVQFISLPLMMPLVAGFMLVYAAIASPSAWWIQLLSFLPPLAPVLMPARIALGHTPAWQVALDVVVMLVAIYALVRLAARIYAPALVRGGARIGWRSALRLRDQ